MDEGARAAIEQKGKSLLPIGIRDVEGHFASGAVVNVKTASGVLFACGVVDYSSDQIRKIKGPENRPTSPPSWDRRTTTK